MNKLEITVDEISSREREIYRTLRTNIEFTGIENRVIAVTSCAPNDGKSTVSYELAGAFAENGKKTLLIDADLRKSVLRASCPCSQLHPTYHLSNHHNGP